MAKLDVATERWEATAEYVRLKADRACEAADRASAAADRAARSAEAAARSADKVDGIRLTMWISSLTTILSVVAISVAYNFGSQQSAIAIAQAVTEAYPTGPADRQAQPHPPSAPPRATNR